MHALVRHVALAAVCLAAWPLTTAFAVEIVDSGKFFSEETLKTANAKIAEIEKRRNTEIRVETFATVPEADRLRVAAMGKAERGKYFSDLIKTRAVAEGAKGVFLLICREPGHLRLRAAASLQDRGFSPAVVDSVTEAIIPGFDKKQYDSALLSGLDQLDRKLGGLSATPVTSTQRPAGHRAPAHQQPAPAGGGMSNLLIWGAVIVGGMFLLSMIMRAFSGGGGAGPGGGGYGGGGGGFGTSLMGGLFGAMAGHWLYDQFSGGHSAQAGDQWGNQGTGDSTGGNIDNDYSGGGDFGGGGDDFGGGDSGGGDF